MFSFHFKEVKNMAKTKVVAKLAELSEELKDILELVEEKKPITADEALEYMTLIDEIDFEKSGKKVVASLEGARAHLNKIFGTKEEVKEVAKKEEKKSAVTLDMIHDLLAEIIAKLEKGHFTAPAGKPTAKEVVETVKKADPPVKGKTEAATPSGDVATLLAEMKKAKAANDNDLARKIRIKLRKMGYSLRDNKGE
jgi:cysteinyl-tRNA synthetase